MGNKYFQAGEGDYYFRRRVWALKTQVAAKKQGMKATLLHHKGERIPWEVKVRK